MKTKENKKNYAMSRDRKNSISAAQSEWEKRGGKKGKTRRYLSRNRVREGILENSNSGFGPERGQRTRAARCSKRYRVRSLHPSLALVLSLSRAFALVLSFSLSLHYNLCSSFPQIGPRAQSFTENTECRRSRKS